VSAIRRKIRRNPTDEFGSAIRRKIRRNPTAEFGAAIRRKIRRIGAGRIPSRRFVGRIVDTCESAGVAIVVFPVWARVGAVTLLVVAGAIAVAVAASGAPAAALPSLLTIPIAVRLAQIRLRADAERIIVRNFWSNWETPRSEIAVFFVKDMVDLSSRSERQRTVYARFRDGTSRRLAATKRDYFKFLPYWPRRNARNQADDICVRLNDWLHAGP
jgi:hypothetical protein